VIDGMGIKKTNSAKDESWLHFINFNRVSFDPTILKNTTKNR